MIIMKEMLNIPFKPGTNMLFHVTYCSNSDGNNCSIKSLVFHLEGVCSYIKECNLNSQNIIDNIDIPAIKKMLLSGNYNFRPLNIVRNKYAREYTDIKTPVYNLLPSTSEDLLVIFTLIIILVKELQQSSYFSASSYCIHTNHISLGCYLDSVNELREMQALIRLNCFKCLYL